MVPVFVDVDIPTYNIDVAAIEAAITPKTKRDHGRPYARQSVRRARDQRALRQAQPLADRGLLRRARRHAVDGKHVGTFGDIGTLSFYPAHHITMGEGGAVFTNDSQSPSAMRILPRLGPRLLLRAGQGQHLQQALRLAARRSAEGLRPQVHLFAPRLQSEDHRHAGRRRPRAARSPRRFHRRAQAPISMR